MPLVQVGPGRYVEVQPKTAVQEVLHFINAETGEHDQYVIKDYTPELDDDESPEKDA